MRYFALAGVLLLSGCGVPSDPEKGPVVLKCDGTSRVTGAQQAEMGSETKFYRIDGRAGTFETWDENNQRWMGSQGKPVIGAASISYSVTGSVGGVTIHTFDFNRSTGTVVDEFATNGSILRFDGKCEPVKDVKSAAKF